MQRALFLSASVTIELTADPKKFSFAARSTLCFAANWFTGRARTMITARVNPVALLGKGGRVYQIAPPKLVQSPRQVVHFRYLANERD